MPFAFHYAARSDVGMVRSNNEDSAYAGPHLLAMADGMGGHAGGDVASSTVIAALVELDDEALGGRDVSQALLDRILAANAEIGEQVRDDPKLDGMGTTLIALLRARDKIVLAHIGDSRAFMVRDGVVTQITKDHSFVQNLVDEGRISSSDAHTHPQRSLVTRVLTGAHDDEPDLVVRQGRIGDRYLIASDGLTDYVARDTVDEILTTEKDPGECADRLVSLALRAGAPDNVTVVVGDLVDINRTMTPPTQPQVVGAAAVRERGTRPIPTTPAAKAWSQQRYFLAEQDGVVTVFRGVDQTVGPVALSSAQYETTIAVDDLPPSYQASLQSGIAVDDRAAADARVGDLRVQAAACRWARTNGETCRTVASTWTTPLASPSPSPSGTATPSGTGAPTFTPMPSPGRTGVPQPSPTSTEVRS